jgi:hypothetical protein
MRYTLTWDARAGIGGYVERYHHRPHSGLTARRPLAWVHFKEKGTLADWIGRLPAAELADVLGSEVSPRLGQAIADRPRQP